MKLAVTAQNGQVFQHFGKCPSFAVFTVEGKAASAPVLLDATGSGHAAMAGFLKNNGVDTVICGGIGARPFLFIHLPAPYYIPGDQQQNRADNENDILN